MYHKAKAGIDMRNHSSKREVVLLHPIQRMTREMNLAWKDFFEKNPDKKEEDIWRRLEERLRSRQNSKGEDREAYALGRKEKIAPLILKRRIWWESVPEASSYVSVRKQRQNNF